MPLVSELTVITSTKFEVNTTIHCWIIAFLLLIHYVPLLPWPLTFWPSTVVINGRSRVQSLHEVWRSYAYPFLNYVLWLSHWQWPMHLQPLHMRQITWPVYRGSKMITHLVLLTLICLFNMQLIFGYNDD